ncbi:TonB-dependent receptor [Aequorivita antarctica]|uniref:TonB-dependent receptor n=1 Tax=Aequorivita antarctica TaxID=153266 RepID=A0A5C6YVK5_9FLAO|nr:TonB-dependent receptor [Aequorivita antarctica]TXD71609.1 TonB-dependent receptor [Aequorivita antarctica]SRX75935.1 TonB-dependent receptor SusC [Aequorivita antarctica]
MTKLYLSLLGLLITVSVFGQEKLSGKTYDAANNTPLVGAKIEMNGTEISSTDSEGNFSVPCSGNQTLTVSYIGYETSVVKVKNCSDPLNISLRTSVNALDEVQLSGTLDNNKKVLEKPLSVIHLEKKELNRGTGLYLQDAINANVPGVTMNRRAVSSGQQFNIRGYGNGVGFRGATNNFDGQGYKVYYNNIPLTDAEGITMLDDIDFGSVSSVDVIKGPAGSLYGFAIAGVVNLTTIRPEKGQSSLSEKVTVGSYGLARFTTQLQMGLEKSSVLLNYGHQISDGYLDHNASRKDFLNAVLDFHPSEKQTVSTYFGFSNSYDERGGELTIGQYDTLDYSGNARYIKNNAHSEVISFRTGLSHKYDFTKWLSNTTTVYGSGLNTNASSAGGWTDKDPINYGTRITFDLNFDLSEDFSLSGVAGLEFQEQRSQSISYGMIENPNDPEGYNIIGALRSNQYSKSKNNSIFTEWILKMPYDISFTAGVGKSSMNLDLKDRAFDPTSGKPQVVSANYEDLFSPHFAVNKIFNDMVSVYASYSKGYKAPVSGNVIIGATGELNTGLEPEEGNLFEIGSKGNLMSNKLHYELALFQAKFKNKFTSVAVPAGDGTTLYSYIANGGELNNKGVEALVKYTAYESATGFFGNVSPYLNVAYSDFKYDNFQYQRIVDGNAVTEDYSGNDVAGVAPWVINAGIDFNTNLGLYGTVNYAYHDPVPFTSDGLNVADSYSLLNAKLGYRMSFGHFDLDAYAGADNIIGEKYYIMLFLNQLDDAYIPAPLDAVFYGGLNLKYNF